jgi:hypothetical protein
VIGIAAITFAAYRDVLGYFFTASDTFTLIATSRADSLHGLARLFAEPLMSGTGFAQRVKFFRPISALSYTLDYWLWGLNPVGYHLTDIVLHILVSILVFLVVRELTGSVAVSGLSAIVFAIHPIHVETVPAIARRQDSLASLFMLLAFWLFMEQIPARGRNRTMLVLSVLAYVLALGAKELAVVFPVLLLSYLLICNPRAERGLKCRVLWTGKDCLPFLLTTGMVLSWRTYVLEGMGGATDTGPATRNVLMEIARTYWAGVLDPGGMLTRFFGWTYTPIDRAGFLLLLFALSLLAYQTGRERPSALIREDSTPQASDGGGTKLILFLLIWATLPLTLYLATLSSPRRLLYFAVAPLARRLLYFGVAPLAALISIQLVPGLRWLSRRTKVTAPSQGSMSVGPVVSSILSGAFCVCLLSQSPLFRTNRVWEASGKISAMFLERLSRLARQLPPEGVIRIYGLPGGISGYENTVPRVETVSYLDSHSIQSWLNLTFPRNRWQVRAEYFSNLSTMPRSLELDWTAQDKSVIAVHVRVDAGAGEQGPGSHSPSRRRP